MPRNSLTSPSNGCNDLYPLEFAVQLLNGTRDDPLDEVLLNMKLCSTEQGRYFKIFFKSCFVVRFCYLLQEQKKCCKTIPYASYLE